jgi:CHAD domain-containing protein
MGHAITGVQRAVAARLRDEGSELGHALAAGMAGDVRGVHRARVASRRLSEALPVAAAVLGKDLDSLGRQLRRLRRALGGIREIDVIRGVLAQEAHDRGWPAALVDQIDARSVTMRDAARERLRRKISRSEALALPKRIRALAADVERAQPAARADALLASRLTTRAKAYSRALAATGVLYAPEPLHGFRIAAKKLRYTLELAREAARLPVSTTLRALKVLQDLLGALRDLQQLQNQIKSAAADAGVDRDMRIFEEWSAALDAECRERHAAFVEMMPDLNRLAGPLTTDVPLRLVRGRPGRVRSLATRSQARVRRVAGGR